MKTKIEKNDRVSCQSTKNPSKWNGRTIEIDDAGTGDLVGDAFIGFRDTDTGKIIFQSVPVGLYNEDNKDLDLPKKHILKVVIKALKRLKHGKGDRILLCRGNCFDLVREYFDKKKIYYKPAIIEGQLQDAVEGRFIQHLRKLGINSRNLTKESGIQRYFIMFDWVCRDFPNRERFVKTGFPSWKKKWQKIAMKRYQNSKKDKASKEEEIKKRAEKINELMFEKPISVGKITSKSL
ncbi:MAG: hypothetical protein JSV62_11390 [Promethearchaeota archaeon]|nr:MAG: hypothetical protein JSV62_11390 [Candidatus Lokiarchaeota archaeon]